MSVYSRSFPPEKSVYSVVLTTAVPFSPYSERSKCSVSILLIFFYPTACVSIHVVVSHDMNGRAMPFSPLPMSNSSPLGLIRQG